VSLVQGLAHRVTAVGAGLPIGQVTAAADRLRRATGLLAATLHASAAPPPTPLLVAAGDHLDSAAGALNRARDELDRYLATVGVGAAQPPATFLATPANETRRPQVERTSFWADRVDLLADLRGAARPERTDGSTVDDLLVAVVRAAQTTDRAGLRATLVAAPAATGLALGSLAADLLRERAGTDFPAVRRAALARIGDLLPGLDAATPVEILSRACRRPVPPREQAGKQHPVDPAVAGPVLLAGLLAADGQDAADLARTLVGRRGGA
jgi:hypothetical protein